VTKQITGIADILPDRRNANKGTARGSAMLEQSLRKYGAGRSIVVDRDAETIGGAKTLEAAAALGLPVRVVQSDGKELIVVQRTDLDLDTDTEARELAIADNRIGEASLFWDLDVLADLGQEIDLSAFWTKEELAALIVEDVTPGGGGDDYDVTPGEGPTRVQPGELWSLGQHRLLCGDSTKREDVERLMGGVLINVAVTSPPYASQRKYDEDSGFKPIHPDGYVDWFESVQASIAAHLAPDGSFFLNIKEHCDGGERHLYVKDLTIAHVRRWRWLFIDELCWQRVALPGLFGPRFKNEWEPVFHFARHTPKFNPENVLLDRDLSGAMTYDQTDGSVTLGQNYKGRGGGNVRSKNFSGALPGNVIRCSKEAGVAHGAQYPVALPEFFIKAYSDIGDVVYDPFMGSGTTLMAAEKAGRKAYGLEISSRYCDVILRRWETETGQQAERID
jgi:site-specific DNA-methyltransferase (adenine-specific)